MAGTFSIPGIVTGMDWGAMVDEIISNSQKAYQPMLTKRDNLERKISVYEEFNQSIRALQTKLTALTLPSIYKAKTTDIARLDSNGLPQAVLTASVTSDAKVMNYDIEVIQKAMTMSRYSKSLSGSIGMDSVFYINNGGKRGKIEVKATDTLDDIARKINNARDITTPSVLLDVSASVVNGQLVVRSTKTGAGSDGKLSQTITRSSAGADILSFYPDLKDETIDGAIVIKNGSTTYQLGLDFDIVGNEIRWRDSDPKAATVGTLYSVGYLPAATDLLGYTVTRARTHGGTKADEDQPMHDSIFSAHTFKYDANGNVNLPGNLDIEWNGNIYSKDVDFVIEGDGIRWLTANRPPDYASYTVEYTPAADEVWLLPAVTRNASDIPDSSSGYAEIISVSPSGSTTTTTNASAPTYSNYMKGGGTAVITQGMKTWVEGVDFDIVGDGTTGNQVSVRWKKEAGASAPLPGSSYDLKLNYTSTSGVNTTTHTYTNILVRDDSDEFEIDRTMIPFIDPPTGTLNGKIYTDNGLIYGESGFTFNPADPDLSNILEGSYTVGAIANGSPWTSSTFTVTWTPPANAPRLRSGLPTAGSSYTVEYTGNMNMFSFDDNGDGMLGLLFDANGDSKDTEGQDAQIKINDGGVRTYSSNTITFGDSDTVFDEDGNIVSMTGLTLNIKGPGKVQIEVSQDAERAVTALQDYIDTYNELMDWINIKLNEKTVDESKKATMSGDDFRMKWGLVYGDRLLSGTKNKLRDISSFTQAIAFQSRTGRETLYGTLGDAGFRGDGAFTIRLGGAKSTITVDIRLPDGSLKKEEINTGGFAVQVNLSENDTLENAAEKINEALKYSYTSDALGAPYYQSVPVYGADGTTIIGHENKLISPSQEIVMGTAAVKNGSIVLTSGFNTAGSEIPLMVQDGSGTLKYLGLNDRYTMLSQIGISTGSSSGSIGVNAKTGILEFDTDKFMEALTADADAVSDLLVSNMKEMDKYLTSLASSAQYEFAPGVVGIQGRVASAINQLQQEINGINKYLSDADRRLEAKADALSRSFSAAEVAISKLSQQAEWLAGVTSSLSGNNNR